MFPGNLFVMSFTIRSVLDGSINDDDRSSIISVIKFSSSASFILLFDFSNFMNMSLNRLNAVDVLIWYRLFWFFDIFLVMSFSASCLCHCHVVC